MDEPATDPLADTESDLEIDDPSPNSSPSADAAPSTEEDVTEAELDTKAAPSPAAGATPGSASSEPVAATAPEEEEVSYDEDLAKFLRDGAGVGSSYDRAYATSAGDRLDIEEHDASSDLFEMREEKPNRHGFGVQLRHSRLSKRLQEIFVERSPGPANQNGFGINYVSRSEAIAFSVALGYDPLDGTDGYYVERGGSATNAGDVDYVDFRDLAWFTLDASAIGAIELHDVIALRYGAGLGVGVLTGQVRKSDAICTSDRFDTDCLPDPNGGEMNRKAKVPPVLPVINALAGIQGRPSKNVSINLDAGIHTFPYVAIGTEVYLW